MSNGESAEDEETSGTYRDLHADGSIRQRLFDRRVSGQTRFPFGFFHGIRLEEIAELGMPMGGFGLGDMEQLEAREDVL